MKRRGLIFNSRPDKAAMFALGLMLGLCPVSQAWADTNITDSQVVAQAQNKVNGRAVDWREYKCDRRYGRNYYGY